ncbi:DUF4255 domain-containing protein [Candidatus Entotheonella palauensis]|uniref:Pvc16 N-terminal domain-containing protein n=1 Tax=Candidatus Entotheonella gemina TaxID=1429439 RepID=W4M311_9BACT|nr:DUF4255 domain-containing protein [Candidatus Entotheonella palauensis]ETX04316.1 MAG: hypothetical protein ETSY2_29455 [Candidatus Entotheonella gemina]
MVDVISLLLVQLNQYLHQVDGNPLGTANPAVWGNIAQLDQTEIATELENQLVLTLVNIEEERTLKNGSTVTREPAGTVHYHNPALHLNLFLLFSANYRNYATALRRLTQVITFFQGKQTFTTANSPEISQSAAPITDFCLTMDLLSLSFEQVSYLWGSLGGKQLPFVLYRGRLVTIRDRRVLEGGGHIQEIEVTSRDATS